MYTEVLLPESVATTVSVYSVVPDSASKKPLAYTVPVVLSIRNRPPRLSSKEKLMALLGGLSASVADTCKQR